MAVQVLIPEGFDFGSAFESALVKALAPAAEIEKLKRQPLLTSKEAETLYGLCPGTLKAWRNLKKGPKFHQQDKGDPVRYTHEDMKAYFTSTKTKNGNHDEVRGG